MIDETSGLIEAIKSSPAGTFKLFRATEEEPEVEQAMANRAELAARIQHAKDCNCLIEVISLRLQNLDQWLRIFFENTPHQEKRKREFGPLLRQCFELGLDKHLYDRLCNFNNHRVNAVHGFLVGTTAYAELQGVVDESGGLSEELVEYVLLNSGEAVTVDFEHQHHNRGDRVFNIPVCLEDLRSREPV